MNEGKIGKVVLKNLTEEEMVEFILSLGEKKFRAAQVYSWVYKNIRDFDEMKNVPKSLRDKLRDKSIIGNLDIELKLESKIDNTKKSLFL